MRADDEPTFPRYDGSAFLSYGFRPFFLSASLFAGLAVPLWIVLYASASSPRFLYPPREWHVHEMLFGFLPAVMAGFVLTAIPNWTGRPPLRGMPLLSLFVLWVGGRLAIVISGPVPLAAAALDMAFLVVLAGFVWREIGAGGSRSQAPIGAMISLYALANMLFHLQALRGLATDVPERLALAILMLLLTMIGGRVTPNFTREFFTQARMSELPTGFALADGLSLLLVLMAAIAWIIQADSPATGWTFLAAGSTNLVRLARWRGWMTWREPLVFILHIGYGWLALSFLGLGATILGMGLPITNAVHILTSGAVGTMTLAVMTRASLGHTGRPRHAGPATVVLYMLVNVGALLRIFVPNTDAPAASTHLMLSSAAACWSGAYVLFVLIYGPFLLRAALDE